MLFGYRLVTISADTTPLHNKEKLMYIAKEEEFKNIDLMISRAKQYLEDSVTVKKEEPKLEYLADENFNAYEVTNYFSEVLASLLVKIGCRELKDLCIYSSIDDLMVNIKKASNLDDDTLTEYGVTILDTMKMLKLQFKNDITTEESKKIITSDNIELVPKKPVPNPADDIIPLPIKEEPVVEEKKPKKIVSIDTKGIIGKINNLTNNIPKETKKHEEAPDQDNMAKHATENAGEDKNNKSAAPSNQYIDTMRRMAKEISDLKSKLNQQQQLPMMLNATISGVCPACNAPFTVPATYTHRLYCFSCGILMQY